MSNGWIPLRFIGEPITVKHKVKPMLSKKPGPPDSFLWQDEEFQVVEELSAWTDYSRRGRMARNMRQPHLESASRRGSWGVGRFYFRVLTEGGRCFDMYFDRAPEEAGDRTGHWFLYREMGSEPSA